MTKTLFLLRHANAADADADIDDYHRPLSATGRQECKEVSAAFSTWEAKPEAVFVSSAVRTSETALYFSGAGCFLNEAVSYEDGLYLATAGELLYRLNNIPESHDSVMMVGHNPGLQDLAVLLLGYAAGDLSEGLVTAGLLQLTFTVGKWHDIVPASAHLAHYVRPGA